MSIDRRQMLLQRSNALAASNREDLPPELRAQYRAAFNAADLALGLQDARQRKTNSQLPAEAPAEVPRLGLPNPVPLAPGQPNPGDLESDLL